MEQSKPQHPEPMHYDLAILGGGAAGLGAAIYAGRYLMKTVLLRGPDPGGATATASTIENYAGFPKIDGFDLIQKFEEHTKGVGGVDLIDETAISINHTGHCFEVQGKTKSFYVKEVILAMGSEHRKLGLPNEKELTGKGIHYCITCDGPLYKDKVVAIVGGGDASIKGGNLAAEYVNKQYLIVRDPKVNAEPINWERYQQLVKDGKAEILYETEIKELIGSGNKLAKLKLSKPVDGSDELAVDAVFVEIGAVPRTELAKSIDVELDDHGQITVDPRTMATNVDGVFACGDITDAAGRFKQDITGVAQGAIAATSAYNDLKIHGDLCAYHASPAGQPVKK